MQWPGANNIANGITIDLGLMNSTTYDPETGIASLQPGGTWAKSYEELEKRMFVPPPIAYSSYNG
jgi:FAD/FMN-containing dehydrogenase